MKKACLISLAIVLLVSLISMSCGATPPATPTGLTCQWISSSQIDLSWNASSGVDGYNVYRCTGASCTPTALVHNESTTSWSDTGLTSNTTYRYRLTAYNEAGESGYSSIVSCTTYNPEAVWNKTFGGQGDDYGCSVQQTSDGGYIIAGSTSSYGTGALDVWLVKTDSGGNEQWDKTFGGQYDDQARSVQQTADGGYIIAGWTNSAGAGGFDAWLIKTDSSGNMAWNKTFGGSGHDFGYAVQQTSDAGYIIAGVTNSTGAGGLDAWLIKTGSSGNMAWNKTFGGSGNDHGYAVQQTSDAGYIITGVTNSTGAGSYDVWLIKADSEGNMAWNKTFGGQGDDVGLSVQRPSGGGYIIAGVTKSAGAGGEDAWLMKTDSEGNEQWDETFGGQADDVGYSVQQTSDGGYVISGWTESTGAGGYDAWLIKADPGGNEQWDKVLGGQGNDVGYSVQQTSDGGYIIAGTTNSTGAGGFDAWLIKVTA
jgi:predicted secreted protein